VEFRGQPGSWVSIRAVDGLRVPRSSARRDSSRSRGSLPIALREDESMPQEVAISRDGRELHLLVMITPLRRAEGGPTASSSCSTTSRR
jgi:hypothetical protein